MIIYVVIMQHKFLILKIAYVKTTQSTKAMLLSYDNNCYFFVVLVILRKITFIINFFINEEKIHG